MDKECIECIDNFLQSLFPPEYANVRKFDLLAIVKDRSEKALSDE